MNICDAARFDALTAITMKNAVSWDVRPSYVYYKNRLFGGTYCHIVIIYHKREFFIVTAVET
jgi:hypothetical protein